MAASSSRAVVKQQQATVYADKGLTSVYLLSFEFLLTNYKILHDSLSDLLLQS